MRHYEAQPKGKKCEFCGSKHDRRGKHCSANCSAQHAMLLNELSEEPKKKEK